MSSSGDGDDGDDIGGVSLEVVAVSSSSTTLCVLVLLKNLAVSETWKFCCRTKIDLLHLLLLDRRKALEVAHAREPTITIKIRLCVEKGFIRKNQSRAAVIMKLMIHSPSMS